MKQELSTGQAAHILLQDDNAAWSYNGAYALVEYLEQLEDDLGESIEMDRVAIRCEFSEYSDAIDAYQVYNNDDSIDESDALQWLYENTTVIEFNGGIIIRDF